MTNSIENPQRDEEPQRGMAIPQLSISDDKTRAVPTWVAQPSWTKRSLGDKHDWDSDRDACEMEGKPMNPSKGHPPSFPVETNTHM